MGYKFTLAGDKIKYCFVGEQQPDPDKITPLLQELKTRKAGAIIYLQTAIQQHMEETFTALQDSLSRKYPAGALTRLAKAQPGEYSRLNDLEQKIHAAYQSVDEPLFTSLCRQYEAFFKRLFTTNTAGTTGLLSLPLPEAETGSLKPQGDPSPRQAWLENVEANPVSTLPQWRQALGGAKEAGVCGLDIETTGLDPLTGRIRLVQLAVPDSEAEETATVYLADCFSLPAAEVLESLAELLANPAIVKVGHNLKFDLSFIRQALGYRLPAENLFDTMLASQLNMAGYYSLEKTKDGTKLKEVFPRHRLADLAKRHLGVTLDKAAQGSDWSGELTPEQLQYAAWDAAILLPLHEVQAELLRKNGLEEVARLEFDCLPALVEMELAGMPFDAEAARKLQAEKEAGLHEVTEKLTKAAKEAGFVPAPKKNNGKKAPCFNPASVKDVLHCFKLLGHTIEDTRDETLQDLVTAGCGFAKDLLEFRGTAKQVTFLKEYLDKQHPADDRLHACMWQLNQNSTGRMSCSSPNLQQVPARGEGKVFRKLFRAPAGKKLVKADLAGIELRIMAWLSKDKTMIEAFQQNADLHKLTAAAMAGKPPEEVTRGERQAAKAVNFGLLYGAGPGRLMDSARYEYGVEMSQQEAEAARLAFFDTYPGIVEWHNKQKDLRKRAEPHWFHLADKGYFTKQLVGVRTASGRKRVWPVYGGNTTATVTRLFNTPDQGTGADIIKAALAGFYRELCKREWEHVALIACIHDEIVVEVPEADADDVAALLVSVMEAAGNKFISPVPAAAESTIGDSW